MRDESGYMMLLLLLPFHQRRKPTNTRPRHTRHGGIPLWQPASRPHTARAERAGCREVLSAAPAEKRKETRTIRTCSGCVFSSLGSRSGLKWRRGLSPGLQDSRACCCCCTRICFFRICETSIDPRRVRGRGGRGGCSAGPDPHRPVGAMEPTSAWSWGRSVTEERTHSGLRCRPAPSRQVFKVFTVVMHERASWTEACLKPRSNNSLQQDTWCLLQKAFILSLCYYFNVFPDVMWLKTHRIQI